MHEHDKTALEIVRRPPTVIVPCRFSVDEHAELKAFADKHGATSSDVIRSALAQCSVITVRAVE